MPRGHHTPLYYRAVVAVENWLALRASHSKDGTISPEAARIERDYMVNVVLRIVVDNAEASHLASTIHRYGPEVNSAERMMARRRKRRATAPVPDLSEVRCLD